MKHKNTKTPATNKIVFDAGTIKGGTGGGSALPRDMKSRDMKSVLELFNGKSKDNKLDEHIAVALAGGGNKSPLGNSYLGNIALSLGFCTPAEVSCFCGTSFTVGGKKVASLNNTGHINSMSRNGIVLRALTVTKANINTAKARYAGLANAKIGETRCVIAEKAVL